MTTHEKQIPAHYLPNASDSSEDGSGATHHIAGQGVDSEQVHTAIHRYGSHAMIPVRRESSNIQNTWCVQKADEVLI